MHTPCHLALLPLVLASTCTVAQPAAQPADAGPNDTEQVLESARSTVQSTAEWLARGVDSWFGDQPFEQGGGKVTDGRLHINLLKREGDKLSLSVRFNARFKLPNFQQQTYLFIGRDAHSEVVSDTPGALSRQERLLAAITEDNAFFAGIGRALTDSVDFRLGLRSGLKPYAQARYRHLWQLENDDLVELRQTVFLTVQDGFGSTTAVSWERALSSTRALRWLTSATFTQDQPKVGWSSLAGAYQSFGHQRLLSLEGIIQGRDGSGVFATDLGVQTRWEQPVYKDRLVGEALMGHFWPRPDAQTPRRAAWALGLGVKMRL
jgi:hypothetical protein